MTARQPPLLLASNITKRFGGITALDGVTLQLRAGEVRGLLGANGAGKSTLISILGGNTLPDAGTLKINGVPVSLGALGASKAAGITIVHQELMLFPDRSVEENIALPTSEMRALRQVAFGRRRSDVEAILERLGVSIDPRQRVDQLSLAEQQLVEIGRALHAGGRILILDEPTSALSSSESAGLFQVVRSIAASGAAVVFVSHHLDEVFEITDTLTVLRDGRVEGEWETKKTSVGDVTAAMVGTVAPGAPRDRRSGRSPLARLTGSAAGAKNIDITIGAGEIVGLAGLEGSGTSTVLKMFAGAIRTSGFLEVSGKRSTPVQPADAVALGAVYMPPDRKLSGLWLDRNVNFNIGLAALNRRGPLALASSRWLARVAKPRMVQVDVRLSAGSEDVQRLSGGNQQRVMLARCLEAGPQLLLLNDFTRGVDVAAKAAIHQLVRSIADSGVGVCLTSSDVDELLEVSDRMICMREGKIVADRPANEFSRLSLLTAIATEAG